APKGRRLHRVAGTVFFLSMLTMATIATVVSPLLPEAQWTNTTAGAFTLYLVATAWLTVRRRDSEVGRFEKRVVVVPLGIAVMGLILVILHGGTPRSEGFATVYVFAVISALAAVGDLRLIRRGGLSGADRIARHVWRMSAALFVAMGSFFLGQQQVLPESVRGTILPVLPVLSVGGLGLFWFLRVRFSRTFNRGPLAA
ncbi:MAG: hypothetical protein Q8M38_09105, partial [Phenylobacterium sp.]|nr:hypothetical protein [Phenylobacterium sp.]